MTERLFEPTATDDRRCESTRQAWREVRGLIVGGWFGALGTAGAIFVGFLFVPETDHLSARFVVHVAGWSVPAWVVCTAIPLGLQRFQWRKDLRR